MMLLDGCCGQRIGCSCIDSVLVGKFLVSFTFFDDAPLNGFLEIVLEEGMGLGTGQEFVLIGIDVGEEGVAVEDGMNAGQEDMGAIGRGDALSVQLGTPDEEDAFDLDGRRLLLLLLLLLLTVLKRPDEVEGVLKGGSQSDIGAVLFWFAAVSSVSRGRVARWWC
jgi:hypothetical protein